MQANSTVFHQSTANSTIFLQSIQFETLYSVCEISRSLSKLDWSHEDKDWIQKDKDLQFVLKASYNRPDLLHFALGIAKRNVLWACVCVCVSVSHRSRTLLHAHGCNFGNNRECPVVVHYWAHLQSVHAFRC